MAVLYGHILNPLKQVTLGIPRDNLDTGRWRGAGGRSVDDVDILCSKLK